MPEKWNTQIYYYISLNPFPTYKKVLKEILKGDDTFYNKDMHMDIKFYYETLFNLNMQAFYTKYRNKIINAYDKTIDKKNDTKTKFCNNLEKQLGKVVNVIKQILPQKKKKKKKTRARSNIVVASFHPRLLKDLTFTEAVNTTTL